MQRESNYIHPESTWSVRILSAVCVGALFGASIAVINYSHAQNTIELPDPGLDVVEVAFFEEAPMPLGEQLDDPGVIEE